MWGTANAYFALDAGQGVPGRSDAIGQRQCARKHGSSSGTSRSICCPGQSLSRTSRTSARRPVGMSTTSKPSCGTPRDVQAIRLRLNPVAVGRRGPLPQRRRWRSRVATDITPATRSMRSDMSPRLTSRRRRKPHVRHPLWCLFNAYEIPPPDA